MCHVAARYTTRKQRYFNPVHLCHLSVVKPSVAIEEGLAQLSAQHLKLETEMFESRESFEKFVSPVKSLPSMQRSSAR